LNAGVAFSHSSYEGRQTLSPVEIIGVAGYSLTEIQFGPASHFNIDKNEIAWFAGDKWAVSNRLTLDLGPALSIATPSPIRSASLHAPASFWR
jgi:hypothetical protein